MKVLLVDDEQKFATMLAKRLALRGIQAEVFFSGEKALAALSHKKGFDVALLDVKMPGIGGIELRRKLAEIDPQMKVVFLTGHGSDMDYTQGANESAEYLPKPLRIDDLVNTLNRLVN